VPALPALREYPLGQIQRAHEGFAQHFICSGLAADITDDTAEAGPDLPKAQLASLNSLAWA
jgi:hypothetical protein